MNTASLSLGLTLAAGGILATVVYRLRRCSWLVFVLALLGGGAAQVGLAIAVGVVTEPMAFREVRDCLEAVCSRPVEDRPAYDWAGAVDFESCVRRWRGRGHCGSEGVILASPEALAIFSLMFLPFWYGLVVFVAHLFRRPRWSFDP